VIQIRWARWGRHTLYRPRVDKHWDIAARRNRRRQIGNLDREPFPFVAHRFELRTRISYRADRAIDVQENWRAGTAIVCA